MAHSPYVTINGLTSRVFLDSDYSLEGDPGEYVGGTKVDTDAECPACGAAGWDFERVTPDDADDVLRCQSCGDEFKLEYRP